MINEYTSLSIFLKEKAFKIYFKFSHGHIHLFVELYWIVNKSLLQRWDLALMIVLILIVESNSTF